MATYLVVWCTDHTWRPSLFSRESPSLKGSLLISPFLPISSLFWVYNFLFDKHLPKMMIFYSNNTLFTRIFGLSVINKQSEANHFKVIFEVVSGDLQNIGVKLLNQTKFCHLSTPKAWHAGAFLIRGSVINPQIGRLPFSDLVNREVSLFWSHQGCHVWHRLVVVAVCRDIVY